MALNKADDALISHLVQRLSVTANVETGIPTNRLILIRDLRDAFTEAGLPKPGLAQTAIMADVLRDRHTMYRKA